MVACSDDDDDTGSTKKDDDGDTTSFAISSTSFTDGGKIAVKHACANWTGGVMTSPQFSWSNPPTDTAKYALIMDDEFADDCGPANPGMDDYCVHWGVFNVPTSTTSYAEKLTPSTVSSPVIQGYNYATTQIYAGVCPPQAHDKYRTTIYALKSTMPTMTLADTNYNTNSGITRKRFESVYSAHILDSATITGTFDPADH